MEKIEKADTGKLIGERKDPDSNHGRRRLVDNWCLKRSRILYGVCKILRMKDVRINVCMRCRTDISKDWGHAWVTYNNRPLLERSMRLIEKPMTMLSDSGKYRYWIYD